jgi:hypothetical protein
MQAAKRIEQEYESVAHETDWAEPETVTFEETMTDGVFEVYAEGDDGEMYLLGFEDLSDEAVLGDVDQMLKERGLREDEITDMHRREMERLAERQRRDRLGWRVLDKVEAEAPGFDGYLHDHQRLIFTGRRNARMARVPNGIGPSMLDEHDKRRLTQEIDMRLSTNDAELAAVMGKNAVVVDTRFDIGGETERLFPHGRTEVLNAPIEELQAMGVDPKQTFIVDKDGAETLFISEGDYYFRGVVTDSGNDAHEDGWIAALDSPAESVEQVLSEHMRPDSVIAAEQAGLDVERQGDWFFIEQHDDFMPTGIVRTPELQPEGECDFLQNHAAEWLGMDALNPSRVFVKGEISHMDDDHSTLDLGDSWFTAQHNGVESRSFECEEFDAETQDRGLVSHPESHGGLIG